jgi:two-component system NarL family response regulator
MRARLLLVDDHAVFREALRSMLERETDIEVVGEAANGADALLLAKELAPDVVLMDISMPGLDGISATRTLKAESPGAKVLALSTYVEEHFVVSMMAAGACGYIVKTSGIPEMVRAIHAVLRGQTFLCEPAARLLAESVSRPRAPGQQLGRREREVLTLVAAGQTSQEIADKLGIATGTVDVHRRNIMRKLALHSVAELTQYAVREGLIKR